MRCFKKARTHLGLAISVSNAQRFKLKYLYIIYIYIYNLTRTKHFHFFLLRSIIYHVMFPGLHQNGIYPISGLEDFSEGKLQWRGCGSGMEQPVQSNPQRYSIPRKKPRGSKQSCCYMLLMLQHIPTFCVVSIRRFPELCQNTFMTFMTFMTGRGQRERKGCLVKLSDLCRTGHCASWVSCLE